MLGFSTVKDLRAPTNNTRCLHLTIWLNSIILHSGGIVKRAPNVVVVVVAWCGHLDSTG